MTRHPTSGPKPWAQYETRTTFLRVPWQDWSKVKIGVKTEFRASGIHATQLWNVTCPTPVVGWAMSNDRRHEARLLVLEATWTEPLAAINEESLEREGFTDFPHFRRYWMTRTKRRFTPMTKVHVYRIHVWTPEDTQEMGQALLRKLYGEHLP
jgi:hypothetical protein